MNKSTNNVRAQFVLENELGLCEECVRLLIRPFSYQPTDHEGEAAKPDCCPLCFGILSSKEKSAFHTCFLGELNKAFDPYGGLHMNYISKDAPTIVLPPLMMVRAQCILGALSNNVDECDLKPVLSHSNAVDICNEMKSSSTEYSPMCSTIETGTVYRFLQHVIYYFKHPNSKSSEVIA